jgi:hypothetical protein
MTRRIDLEKIRRHPVVRAANPVTTGQTAKSNPTVTVVTLTVILVALNVWKGQATPSFNVIGKDFLFVVALVAIATVAPTIVIGVLWVALLLWVLMNEPAIADMIRRVSQAVDLSGSGGSIRPKGV